jgi:hypothetical protein
MQWTEQAISASLDGSFTRVDHWGNFVTKKVPKSFVPDYSAPIKRREEGNLGRGIPRKPWTPAQDAMLLTLRREGVILADCTKLLRRGIKQIRARLLQLTEGAQI